MGTGLISASDAAPRGIVLRSFDDFVRFGEFAAASSFAPTAMRGKPQDCTLAIMLGAEIGLGPMAALQGIAVINGRPSAWGDALIAVVKASPVCEYVTETVEGEGEAMVARCEAKRRGHPEPTVVTFTVADAKRAGLWGREGIWKNYPKRMLQMRARGFALRDAFPDVLRGVITREEAEDYDAEPPAKAKPSRRSSEKPVVVDAQTLPAPQPKASDPEKTRVERAMDAIAAATTVANLIAIQGRADKLRQDGEIEGFEYDEITQAVDRRADELRPPKKPEATNGQGS